MDFRLVGFLKASKHRIDILALLENEIVTPTEISNKLNIHRSQVSRLLSELVERRLIEVSTPNLRKGKVYSLTEKGKEYLTIMKGESS